MHYQVCLEVALLVEPLVTQRTRVRLFRVVSRLVRLQVALVLELLPADLTIKRLIIKMYASVALEVVDVLERPTAYLQTNNFQNQAFL